MHERHLFPTLGMLLMCATWRWTCGDKGVRGRWLWWAYGLLTLTLLFNLVTIAPPPGMPLGNLVAAIHADAEDPLVQMLQALSLVASVCNIAVLVGLVIDLAVVRQKE
jgi:hypothetical protein